MYYEKLTDLPCIDCDHGYHTTCSCNNGIIFCANIGDFMTEADVEGVDFECNHYE